MAWVKPLPDLATSTFRFKTNFHHLHQILIFITKRHDSPLILTNIRWCQRAPPMLIAAAILVLMHDYTYLILGNIEMNESVHSKRLYHLNFINNGCC